MRRAADCTLDRLAIRPREIPSANPFTHRSRGAGVVFGPPTGGGRFARPPANVCDPYWGRRVVSATSSPNDIAATRTAVSDVSARWVPSHHKPCRGNEFTVHPKLPWRGLRNEPGVERSDHPRSSAPNRTLHPGRGARTRDWSNRWGPMIVPHGPALERRWALPNRGQPSSGPGFAVAGNTHAQPQHKAKKQTCGGPSGLDTHRVGPPESLRLR